MKIDWNKYVDHIYSVTCTKNVEQIDILKKELERVDILHSGIYTNFINVDSPFYKLIYDNVNKLDDVNPFNGATKLTYAIYYLLRLSYELGYERVIVMEDDVKFLKDKEKIISLLEKIDEAKDFDIIVGNIETTYDHYYDFENNSSNQFIDNVHLEYISERAYYEYFSCSTINIYSRSGMEKLINFFEHIYCVIDRYNLFTSNMDINIYAIYPWLGVQQRYAYDLADLTEINNYYNLQTITDKNVYDYIIQFNKPSGINDDNYAIYWIPPIGRKEFIKRLLKLFKDKTSELYKECQEIYEST